MIFITQFNDIVCPYSTSPPNVGTSKVISNVNYNYTNVKYTIKSLHKYVEKGADYITVQA